VSRLNTHPDRFDARADCARAPELQVLLSSVCLADHEARALRGALDQVVDWGQLESAARFHGMEPLLCRRISTLCPDAVPPAFLEDLRLVYSGYSRRNLRMASCLLRTLDNLSARGIRAASFKGPLLAEFFYGDLGLRQMSDLDLLVGAHDYAAARRLLLSDGFKQSGGRTDEGAPKTQQAFWHEARGLMIELHCHAVPGNPHDSFSAEHLLSRAQPTTLLGRKILSVSVGDLFVLLCFHGEKHRWASLDLITDLAAFIAKDVVDDWRRLLDDARARDCLRRCHIGAVLAHEVVGVALPAELEVSVARDPVALRLARRVYGAGSEAEPWGAPSSGLSGVLWDALARDTLQASIGHFARRAITPTDRDTDWISLPPAYRGLYYGLRPVRLALRTGRRFAAPPKPD